MNNTIQVTAAQLIIALIGAAAIGALVSSLITLVGQWFERKSRREELLLAKAIELTDRRLELVMKAAQTTKISVEFSDPAVMSETYYQWLKHLMRHDKLPDDSRIKRPTDL